MSTAKVFAIALYDNEAESDDELTFKKNDLLQVLECDYMGMEGKNHIILNLAQIQC